MSAVFPDTTEAIGSKTIQLHVDNGGKKRQLHTLHLNLYSFGHFINDG